MNTAPKWFTPVAVLALLWNLLGCFMIAMDAMMPPDAVAALPADQQAIHAARAPWMVIGSIVAVAAGALGSLGLVLKRRWATPLLILSVLGLVVQDLGFALISRTLPIPMAGWIMQGLVLVIAILLVVMARKAAAAGWLR